jgi:septal ring factor EnvC (AmiA/AmiB activator)
MNKPVVESETDEIAAHLRREEAALLAANAEGALKEALLDERLHEIRSQSEALEALAREQEAYLREVEAQIEALEERRRAWRRRFAAVTERAPEPAVPSAP